MAELTEADLKDALRKHGGGASKSVLDDPKAFKATFDILKGMAAKETASRVLGVASGVASLSNSVLKTADASSSAKGAVGGASMAMSTFKATMDLTKITKMTSIGAAVTYIGATTVQKTGLAVSLVGADGEKAKCVGAIMELAGSATVTAITAPTGILLALSAASLTASAINAYNFCGEI